MDGKQLANKLENFAKAQATIEPIFSSKAHLRKPKFQEKKKFLKRKKMFEGSKD